MKLQAGAIRPFYASYDAFRRVPKEMAEASITGALMTVVTAITCAVLFFCELRAFLTAELETNLVIDQNEDATLRINFDVHMLDMSCDYMTVGVWDAFGTERMNITRNMKKQRIGHNGARKGHPYSEDELNSIEFGSQMFTKEELSELDSDWGSTSDNFKHDSFQAVVSAHDFTMVNFYADWCPHCRQFSPIWVQFENKVNQGNEFGLDADGVKANVRVLKVNCVDFEQTCQEQKVQAFPSIRMYRRGAKEKEFKEYRGRRELAGLSAFMKDEVKLRHTHMNASFHDLFSEGCRMTGNIEVARVPGTVHFQAQHTSDRTLNLAFTNVSHTVHHFSFGERPYRTVSGLPREYKKHVTPLDGKTFTTDTFHKAPVHYIKVVHTRFPDSGGVTSYQQTHQTSVRTLQRRTVPQAKFSYDLSPVEVVVTKGQRRWYDFLTQCLAIIGGAVSFMSLTSGVLNTTHRKVKSMIGKDS